MAAAGVIVERSLAYADLLGSASGSPKFASTRNTLKMVKQA
jgi:hypothetical protein